MSEPVTGGETVKEWLDSLASSTTSFEQDDDRMQNLLHRIGITKAICVCGIVYLEGKGTIQAPPMDIHTVAKWVIIKYKEGNHGKGE